MQFLVFDPRNTEISFRFEIEPLALHLSFTLT